MAKLLQLPDNFNERQLVVDLPHIRLVANALREMVAVPDDQIIEDKGLDLALLNLDGVEAAADKIEGDRPEPIGKLKRNLKHTFEPLDTVLDELRTRFKIKYDGWIPALGKNRYVDSVIGLPQSKPLSATDPVAVDLPSWPRTEDTSAGAGARVGVLDTVYYLHLAHEPYEVTSTDTLTEPPDGGRYLWSGHASFVTGLVVEQAPAAEIVHRQGLEATGRNEAWDVARKIVGFASHGVHVLNLSLGCRTYDGEPPLVMQRAVERLGPHVLVVAAAGNHATTKAAAPVWPAALPRVVAVGARDGKDATASFSPQRPWITCTAPGVDVVSTYLDGEYAYAQWSGTSFAAATTSGRIAARMVPGKSAREALDDLLGAEDRVVHRYEHGHDGSRA